MRIIDGEGEELAKELTPTSDNEMHLLRINRPDHSRLHKRRAKDAILNTRALFCLAKICLLFSFYEI